MSGAVYGKWAELKISGKWYMNWAELLTIHPLTKVGGAIGQLLKVVLYYTSLFE